MQLVPVSSRQLVVVKLWIFMRIRGVCMCGSPEAGERLERTKNVPQFTHLAPSQKASMAKECSKQGKVAQIK